MEADEFRRNARRDQALPCLSCCEYERPITSIGARVDLEVGRWKFTEQSGSTATMFAVQCAKGNSSLSIWTASNIPASKFLSLSSCGCGFQKADLIAARRSAQSIGRLRRFPRRNPNNELADERSKDWVMAAIALRPATTTAAGGASTTATTTRYVLPDHLNSSNVLTDASGTVIQVLEY